MTDDAPPARLLIAEKLQLLQNSSWGLTESALAEAFDDTVPIRRRFIQELIRFSKLASIEEGLPLIHQQHQERINNPSSKSNRHPDKTWLATDVTDAIKAFQESRMPSRKRKRRGEAGQEKPTLASGKENHMRSGQEGSGGAEGGECEAVAGSTNGQRKRKMPTRRAKASTASTKRPTSTTNNREENESNKGDEVDAEEGGETEDQNKHGEELQAEEGEDVDQQSESKQPAKRPRLIKKGETPDKSGTVHNGGDEADEEGNEADEESHELDDSIEFGRTGQSDLDDFLGDVDDFILSDPPSFDETILDGPGDSRNDKRPATPKNRSVGSCSREHPPTPGNGHLGSNSGKQPPTPENGPLGPRNGEQLLTPRGSSPESTSIDSQLAAVHARHKAEYSKIIIKLKSTVFQLESSLSTITKEKSATEKRISNYRERAIQEGNRASQLMRRLEDIEEWDEVPSADDTESEGGFEQPSLPLLASLRQELNDAVDICQKNCAKADEKRTERQKQLQEINDRFAQVERSLKTDKVEIQKWESYLEGFEKLLHHNVSCATFGGVCCGHNNCN